VNIRPLQQADWASVKAIYIQGIDTKMATFETEVPTWKSWISDRIAGTCFVAEDNDAILGWAALSPYSSRCVYEGIGEVSIYIAKNARGKGFGKLLLKHLIEISEQVGIWTLQAGIFPENKGSISLHEQLGFKTLGTSEKLGKLDGVWRDVVHLERRSKVL
jgi:L-amino acid N-acyltransferase YncA